VNSRPSFSFDKLSDETVTDESLADFQTYSKLEMGGASSGTAPGTLSLFLQTCKVINNPRRIILHTVRMG
jgi:hypothetical protein